MRRIALAAALLVAGTTVLAAQSPKNRPEIRPFAGANIPTGNQRDLFLDAPLFGVQAALELKPTFHLLGSFGWVASQSHYPVVNNNVSIFQYDVGVEFDMVRPLGGNWEFKPFIGVGGGARTYSYKGVGLADKTCAAGYAALGTEFQIGPTALRFEARDNVFCYRSPVAGVASHTRNDVGLALGVAYHLR
jgi:hypothetical protein